MLNLGKKNQKVSERFAISNKKLRRKEKVKKKNKLGKTILDQTVNLSCFETSYRCDHRASLLRVQ